MTSLPFSFVPLPDFVLARADVSMGAALLVAAILARYDFRDDEAHVGQRSLARRMGGRDRTNVRRWLAELEACGLARVLGRTSSGYTRVRVIPPGGEGAWRPRGSGAPGGLEPGQAPPQKNLRATARAHEARAAGAPEAVEVWEDTIVAVSPLPREDGPSASRSRRATPTATEAP